jgi:type IV pilus assembly protein PilQ
MAAVSVYADPAKPVGSADSAGPVSPAGDAKPDNSTVRLLDSGASAPTATDASAAPTAPAAGDATTQPVTIEPAAKADGKSVRDTDIHVSDAGTVEIHVNEANLVEVLRMLSIQSQKNIIASKEVQGVVTANLYDVTVREALDAILKANGFGYKEQGNFIYVYSAKEIADMDKANRHMTSEVFRLYYTPAANAQNMLKPVLSETGQVAYTQPAASGIATGTSDVGGDSHADDDSIVVTDFPENLDKVRALLKEIDRRPQQILIEATILRAALTDENDLGIDFNFLGGVNLTSFTETNGQINSTAITPASSSGATTGTGTGTTGTGTTAGGQPVTANQISTVGTGNTFSNGTNGFRVGFATHDMSFLLNALESTTNTTVLANPKILALNKQRGEVIVGRKDGYYTTTVTQNATVQSVDFLETGTRLVFRPFVGDDGYVRMEVHPEDSSGGLNASNLPFKVTTEVTSNVLVKDGNTIVIGGLFREVNETNTQQVPFFGSLPLAGYLFRKQADTSTREEVIILLTPHIIKDQSVYSENSLKMLKDADKLRVGVRQGMMPFSVSRLAEISYDQARAEMEKPNPNRKKAIWYLNCATSLDPTFPEAVLLKESLTGEEITATDHSLTRDFLKHEILSEEAAGATIRPSVHSVQLRGSHEESARLNIKSDAVAVASPTTRPAVDVAVTPATQPAQAVAVSPATQPAQSAAQAPTAQTVEVVVQAPATRPAQAVTEAPVKQAAQVAVQLPTTQPAQAAAQAPGVQPTAAVTAIAPATLPATTTTITELPTEDAAK